LLVLTDRSQLPLSRSLLATLADCVAAGGTAIVVRELDESPAQRAALAEAVAALGATVIAAHGPLPGARGVHLSATQPVSGRVTCNAELVSLSDGPDGAAVAITLRYMEPAAPWGRSCHSAAEVRSAAEEGAGWATLSPYAVTASKPGYGPALPADEYAAAATAGIPVYALGGVTPDSAAAALAAGAHGVAVMGEVMRSYEPGAVVAGLLAALGEGAPIEEARS